MATGRIMEDFGTMIINTCTPLIFIRYFLFGRYMCIYMYVYH